MAHFAPVGIVGYHSSVVGKSGRLTFRGYFLNQITNTAEQ